MLEAADLACERGGRRLFRGLSFAVTDGELLRIAGANGQGKTSLLRILCGLLTPTAGVVRWGGEPIGSLREEYSRSVLFLGHAPAVKDDLTAAENLAIACQLAGVSADEERIADALGRFGLPEQPVFVRKLSQGQRRRAALARLLLSEAVPLWLLDEPLAALDTAAAELVESLISAHVARGGMAIYTTHQEARVEATRVVTLEWAVA